MFRKTINNLLILILFFSLLIPPVYSRDLDKEEKVEPPSQSTLDVNDYIRDTAIYYSAIWAGRLFYVRNKNSRIFRTSFEDWWDNISQFPEVDDGDAFFTNYIVHPYIGSLSYMYYREMGHDFWPSALGSFIQSTLFEYTVEGLVETPSLPDLIATPGLGVPLGYFLEKSSDWLETKDSRTLQVASKILNPMKLVVNDRKIVLFNPLTGNFEFKTDFDTSKPVNKHLSLDLSYPVFFEPAVPRGFFTAFIEFIDLENDFEGQFIAYHIKAEFPNEDYSSSFYLKVSQAGVNDTVLDGVDIRDGFEFANMLAGYKRLLHKDDNSAYSLGFEAVIPTAYKDNIDRLNSVINHKRDFPLYLVGAFTLSPYASFALWKGVASLQGSIGTDFIVLFDGDELEGDNIEWRVKYSLSAGTSIPMAFSPLVFAEFNGYSQFTSDETEDTDLFAATGFRFGNRFSPGFTVQFPIEGSTSDIASASYIFDIRLKF